MSAKTEATINDLYRVPENGKAELVTENWYLCPPPEGYPAALPAGSIGVSMTTNGVSEVVMRSRQRWFHRESFQSWLISPDAAFYKAN